MRVIPYLAIICGLLSCVYAAPKPVKNLHVSFVGRNFDVDSATTVEEVQKEVQKQVGSVGDKMKLTQVVFGGEKLAPTAFLRDAGVTDGAKLNMIPDASSTMKDMMEQAGMDSNQLEEMMKGMGGDGKMPSLQESMEMMSGMVNSPMFQELMNDPEKLEMSRQMVLKNPMLKSMMSGMPGMEELLNNPDAWRETMQAAANMYKSMDPDQLMNSMMGNSGGLDGLGDLGGAGGLFDGTLDKDKSNNKAAAAALDELSEGDD